jgi:hypothetical protein
MSDANVAVNFSASTADFQSGLAAVRDSLAGLSTPIAEVNSKFAALGAALAESHARAMQAIQTGNQSACADLERSALEAMSGQIKAEQDGLKEKLAAYADDARNHRISEQEKLQATREAVEESYAAELDLMNRKRSLAQSSMAERQRIDNQVSQLERNEQRELSQITREALDEQTRSYVQFGLAVTSAFNGQLRGLLSGAETWRDAVKKTLGQLLIDFIETGERTVVQWVAGRPPRRLRPRPERRPASASSRPARRPRWLRKAPRSCAPS